MLQKPKEPTSSPFEIRSAPPPDFTFHAPLQPPRFHISRPPQPLPRPPISHFTPRRPPRFHISRPPPPAAPQISHFTPPCGPPGFTFHAPHPRFHISRPAPPPRFHISRCLARLKEVTGSRLQPPDYIGSRGHACSPPTQRPAFPPATLRPIRSNSEPQTASDRRWP